MRRCCGNSWGNSRVGCQGLWWPPGSQGLCGGWARHACTWRATPRAGSGREGGKEGGTGETCLGELPYGCALIHAAGGIHQLLLVEEFDGHGGLAVLGQPHLAKGPLPQGLGQLQLVELNCKEGGGGFSLDMEE